MRQLSTLIGLAPLFLATALPAQAQMVTITPAQIGEIFCIASLGNDMAPAEALLSPDLSVYVANAWASNAGFLDNNPEDKPPLGDGLPWRTWPDYADGCAVGASSEDGQTAQVTIAYSFSEAPDANYENVLMLKQVMPDDGAPGPVWRIDDIDLGEGLTFRSAIAGAFSD